MRFSTTTKLFFRRHSILTATSSIVVIVGISGFSVMVLVALHPERHVRTPKIAKVTVTRHVAPKATPVQPPAPAPKQPAPEPIHTLVAPPTPPPAPLPAPARVAQTATAPTPAASLAPAPAPKQPAPPAPDVPTSPSYTSSNWAGYMASTENYTAINGSWVIPSARAGSTTATSADATWIGIGGAKSSDLIQIGTEDTVSAQGIQSSAVFYEMLPSAAVYPASITVAPGDTVSASLHETSQGVWQATITDTTTGQNFSVLLDYASTNSSSEWIEEDPSYSNGQPIPLDAFDSVSFSGGTTIANGTSLTIAGSGAGSITLVNGSAVRISVSSLSIDGGSFIATEQ
ncbi:MAG TPA: G1 family glutamic endopeptidase [Candidatus Saccharimonadaceae bacterium]|nr:G1 family glutamic endopeptidase [Candidatus Saccharimonadaceae bacterium]